MTAIERVNWEFGERDKRRAVSRLRQSGELVVCDRGYYRRAKSAVEVRGAALPLLKHALSELLVARRMLNSRQFAELLGQIPLTTDLVAELANANKQRAAKPAPRGKEASHGK